MGTREAQGFTLLEMLLVIFLMALVASAGLMLTEGVEEQSKYDETKRRMELIRKAIVGDPTRTVNGGPEISGFVADMGRLPNCLRELVEALDCSSPGDKLPTSVFDSNSGLLVGWRGPYISLLPDGSDGKLRIRDGYENDDGSIDFGWGFLNDGTQIQLQSFGLNTVPDGGTQVDDYPLGPSVSAVAPLVNVFDYSVTFQNWASVTIRFTNTGAGPVSIEKDRLRLVLSFADDSQPDAIGTVESASFPPATLAVPINEISVTVKNGQTLNVPNGTTLNGNALSFATGKVHFVDINQDVNVTNGSGAEVPAGSTLNGTQVTIGSDGVVQWPASTQLTLTSPFPSLPDTMGHFSLSIVCNDPDNLTAVDGKRYDGDCARYGTDEAPETDYTPTNQPYLFHAAPRGTPVLPPSPLVWSIQQ